MIVTPTHDMDRITKIVSSRYIYHWVSDDFSPKREEFRAIDAPGTIYLVIEDEDQTLGCFTFVPQNGVCYEVHTCLLPIGLGYASRQATALAAEWMFKNTSCRRIVTNVPADNPLALKLAVDSGMKIMGMNPGSYLKHSQLLSQTMLGMSREDICL